MAWLLTIPEAAVSAHLSVRTIERHVASGVLESTLVGRRSRRIFAESLKELIANGYCPPERPGEAA